MERCCVRGNRRPGRDIKTRIVLCAYGMAEVRSCSVAYGMAEVRSCSGAPAWPRSGRALWLLLGRGHLVLCGVCVAEVRSRSGASAWPRSSRALWCLRGRSQVALWGFCLAEVISCSLVSAWPRSGLRPWLLQLILCRARSYRFEARCFARLRSEWGLFFFCSPVQFSFSVVHSCRLGAWLISLLQP